MTKAFRGCQRSGERMARVIDLLGMLSTFKELRQFHGHSSTFNLLSVRSEIERALLCQPQVWRTARGTALSTKADLCCNASAVSGSESVVVALSTYVLFRLSSRMPTSPGSFLTAPKCLRSHKRLWLKFVAFMVYEYVHANSTCALHLSILQHQLRAFCGHASAACSSPHATP